MGSIPVGTTRHRCGKPAPVFFFSNERPCFSGSLHDLPLSAVFSHSTSSTPYLSIFPSPSVSICLSPPSLHPSPFLSVCLSPSVSSSFSVPLHLSLPLRLFILLRLSPSVSPPPSVSSAVSGTTLPLSRLLSLSSLHLPRLSFPLRHLLHHPSPSPPHVRLIPSHSVTSNHHSITSKLRNFGPFRHHNSPTSFPSLRPSRRKFIVHFFILTKVITNFLPTIKNSTFDRINNTFKHVNTETARGKEKGLQMRNRPIDNTYYLRCISSPGRVCTRFFSGRNTRRRKIPFRKEKEG